MPDEPTITTSDDVAAIQLMPKQAAFVSSDAEEILYSGAFGAGKTRALCYRALRLASEHPAVRFGLCRKTLVSLKMTTLRTLLEADGDLPPVLLPGTYEYSKTPGDTKIKLNGGGEIIPFGCDDEQKVGSLQLTDCGVDEAVELDREEWDMLLGRTRVTYTKKNGEKNNQTLAGVCNPGSPGHFLHDIFFKRGGPSCHLIQTSTVENWYLPPAYVRKLIRRYYGAQLKRYVYGEWAIAEGAVYPMLVEDTHWVHRPGPFLRYVGGVDYGFINPMVCRVHGIDGDGCSHVVAELYRTGVTSDAFAEICKATSEHYSPIVFVVDPSAPELIATMRHKGLSVIPANNDVLGGINAVQNMLVINEKTSRPRLTMEPSCKQGNTEYLGYRWNDKKPKDEPVKRDDHACFSGSTSVMMGDGSFKYIEEIGIGESVMTPVGPQNTLGAGVTRLNATLVGTTVADWSFGVTRDHLFAKVRGAENRELDVDQESVTMSFGASPDSVTAVSVGDMLGREDLFPFLRIQLCPVSLQGFDYIIQPTAYPATMHMGGESSGPAYCLTVPCGWFVLANGLVVKNCDADRYAVMYINSPKRGRRLRSLQLSPSVPRIQPSVWTGADMWN